MTSVSEVLNELGGANVVAELLGVTPQAITNMKARGSIPSRHWPKLVAAAAEKRIAGVTLETLVNINASAAA